jgi:tRNA threonylcarbamoyl adenosine modification protein YjeE
MAQPLADPASWRIELPNLSATEELAAMVADLVGANELLTVSGDIGAGKTTFARALIRRLAGDPTLEVPSPTFTLMQIYDTARFPIVHADLFRIGGASELIGLGWEEVAEGALVIVEWPQRVEQALKADRLDIEFAMDPKNNENFRIATLTGFGAVAATIARVKAIRELLEGSGWTTARRTYVQGDASTRIYERLTRPNGDTVILMISPPRAHGPPIRSGKSYLTIARLAETIVPYIAVAKGLRTLGFSAPAIIAENDAVGVALVEDLGSEGIIEGEDPIADRYAEATALLAHLHGLALSDTLPLGDETYRIPPYDLDALSIEVEVLLDWYIPHVAAAHLSSGARATFVHLWRAVLAEIAAAPPTWTLRDYHSPNLMWLPDRSGFARIGLIDFQDCVLGHPAYDLAALLQDARVCVPDSLEIRLLGEYVRHRQQQNASDLDVRSFTQAYAILGVQRVTKILGIFARLEKRDHKPQYLRHIPRLEHYLRKGLAHPAMAEIRAWFQQHLPKIMNAKIANEGEYQP